MSEITIGGGSSKITIDEAVSLAEKLVAVTAALISIIKAGKADITIDEEITALKELYLTPRAEIEAEVDATTPPA
jgi:hypothetical protein